MEETNKAKETLIVSLIIIITSSIIVYTILPESLSDKEKKEIRDNITIENPDYSNYSPIKKVNATQKNIQITLSNDLSGEDLGEEEKYFDNFTHIQLIKENGKLISERRRISPGMKTLIFKTNNNVKGNYTLVLYKYEPPQPGLLGVSEEWKSTQSKFTITENNKIKVTKLPEEAHVVDRELTRKERRAYYDLGFSIEILD